MPLRTGTEMPALSGATEWLGESVAAESLVGAPTLVHFWSVSCYICKNNLPRLAAWKETYGPRGLRFVAVHLPREEAETDVALVRAAAAEHGIDEPCAIDNQHALATAYGNDQAWVPYYFLFDAEGKLKTRGAGQVAADTLEGALARMFPAT